MSAAATEIKPGAGDALVAASGTPTDAIRKLVRELAAEGIDGKTIAISLYAAATHEMINAYGKDEAGKLAAQMYVRGFLS